MRTIVSIVLIGAFSTGLFGAEKHISHPSRMSPNTRIIQREGVTVDADMSQSTFNPALRELAGVLIDSSKNGYGMVSPSTRPISRNESNPNEFFLSYRQWAGALGTSGQLGAAYSSDGGTSWTIYSELNAGLSPNGARYPSVVCADDFPVLIWNESGDSHGGGDNQGVGYYTFDEGGYDGEVFFTPTRFHHDPGSLDAWVMNPVYNSDGAGNEYFNIRMTNWSETDTEYMSHTSTTAGWGDRGALAWDNAYKILDGPSGFFNPGNYTSSGDFDINDSGIGYFVVSSFMADTLVNENHTLFAKKTTDYGATWSPWHWIPDQIMNAHFEDIFVDSLYDESLDTTYILDNPIPFIGYSIEVVTSENGDLHMWSDIVPNTGDSVWPNWQEENGIYHFLVAESELTRFGGPVNTTISFVASMQDAFSRDLPSWGGLAHYSAARDAGNEDNYYMITSLPTHESEPGAPESWTDINIVGAYSVDNGASWSDPEQLTFTEDGEYDEYDGHINRVAQDGSVTLLYQIPDWNVHTVPDDDGHADFMNRLFFLEHNFQVPLSTDDFTVTPDVMSLSQNYPNPFNPSTEISFIIGAAGHTSLTVFDIRGRELVTLINGELGAGQHQVLFKGEGLPSGTYFYELAVNGQREVRKMMLLK